MAIPVDVVQPIVNSIIQYGKVTRPKLGISVMTIRGSEKPTVGLIPAGVYVSAVGPESTAERAGIKAHDIIIGMDGERIALHTDLTNRLAARSAGDVITLTIYRIPGLEKLTVQDEIPAGEELEIQITLEMPSQDTYNTRIAAGKNVKMRYNAILPRIRWHDGREGCYASV